jgi:phage baseplate assembly protein W
MASGLTLKLPIALDEFDSIKMVKNFPELVEQNLKNLILTMPGERVMDPTFGVGILRFLFEQNNPMTYTEIRAKIDQQVNKYMPFVRIDDIVFSSSVTESPDGFLSNPGKSLDPNFVGMKIVYTIVPLKATKSLNL